MKHRHQKLAGGVENEWRFLITSGGRRRQAGSVEREAPRTSGKSSRGWAP